MKRTKKEWLNYIAAFFDGEGNVTIKILKNGKARKYYKFSPEIFITQKTENVLIQIKKILKFGKIYKRLRCERFDYGIRSHADILEFIKLIKPYSIVKTIQLSLIKKLIFYKETRKIRNNPYTKEELKIMLKIRDDLHKLNGGKLKYTSKQILRKLNCK